MMCHVYVDSDYRYRRNVQSHVIDDKSKRFAPRSVDNKIACNKMTDNELERLLSRLESAGIHHGMMYRICTGVTISLLSGGIVLIGLIVLGLVYWRTKYFENWVLAVVILLPMFLGLVLFLCICGPKRRIRKERLHDTYSGIEEDIVNLNREYNDRRIILFFNRNKKTLEIDYQTNDPLQKLKEKSKLSSSNSQLTANNTPFISPMIPMEEISPRPAPAHNQRKALYLDDHRDQYNAADESSLQVINYRNYDVSMYDLSKQNSLADMY